MEAKEKRKDTALREKKRDQRRVDARERIRSERAGSKKYETPATDQLKRERESLAEKYGLNKPLGKGKQLDNQKEDEEVLEDSGNVRMDLEGAEDEGVTQSKGIADELGTKLKKKVKEKAKSRIILFLVTTIGASGFLWITVITGLLIIFMGGGVIAAMIVLGELKDDVEDKVDEVKEEAAYQIKEEYPSQQVFSRIIDPSGLDLSDKV